MSMSRIYAQLRDIAHELTCELLDLGTILDLKPSADAAERYNNTLEALDHVKDAMKFLEETE